MKGPYPTGSSVVPQAPNEWEIGSAVRGQRYRVIKQFVDGDEDSHPVGEEWLFLGAMFDRQFDDYVLCVQSSSGQEWAIKLNARPARKHESDVVDNFLDFVAPVEGDGTARIVPPAERVKFLRLVNLTDAAVRRARELSAQYEKPYFRVAARFSDSTGLICELKVDDHVDLKNDYIDQSQGVTVVVDLKTSMFLKEATIDWRPAPAGGAFAVVRPKG